MAAEKPVRVLLLLVAFAGGAAADAVVTGVVFCDLCRDGSVSLFDYPVSGAKVAVSCLGADGLQVTGYGEQTTGFAGTFGLRLEADMSRCSAQVVAGPSGCDGGAGLPQRLAPTFQMFGTEFYMVDPLLSQPAEPAGFCQQLQPPPPIGLLPPPPAASSPAFACPHEAWMELDHRCYWKMVGPDTPVAVAFGVVAAQKYSMGMTLWEALQGRGDLYRALLREATTALLNSYNGSFYYPTLEVVDYMNRALLGSASDAMRIAMRFRRANSGSSSYGGGACSFTPCS